MITLSLVKILIVCLFFIRMKHFLHQVIHHFYHDDDEDADNRFLLLSFSFHSLSLIFSWWFLIENCLQLSIFHQNQWLILFLVFFSSFRIHHETFWVFLVYLSIIYRIFFNLQIWLFTFGLERRKQKKLFSNFLLT